MPDHPTLREGFLAWDRGDYPDAIRHYLGVLNSAEGAANLDEIALLTGELYKVTELAVDGSGVMVSRDGRLGAYQAVEGGEIVTEVVDLESGAVTATLRGTGAVLGTAGRIAFFRVSETPGLRAARGALAESRRTRDFQARARAQAEFDWEEAKARTTYLWSAGSEQELSLGDLAPRSLVFDRDGSLFTLASHPDRPSDVGIYRIDPTGTEAVVESLGAKSGLVVVPGGRLFVYTNGTRVTVSDRTGGVVSFRGASQPTVSEDGRILTFLRGGTPARIEAVALPSASLGASLRPTVAVESDRPIANPVVSPDGSHVAYQKMAVDDWEIFAAGTDGSGEVQLSIEIQHDRNPVWLDETRVLAAKGEGRHMRSFIYDLAGGTPLKLFHNNTIRTIAPEYDWAVSRDGSKILLVSERDGDTVSPERGVYLVDLTSKVTVSDVRTRLEEALAVEESMRDRGERAFASIAGEVRATTEGISVARIYEAARDVYAFGSKHITQPGNAMAIEYYEERLREYGYEPELQWFEARPGIQSANLVVTIPGTVDPELVYVASSHFDSVERGPGADDDSSGATALLEVARVLRDHAMPATIELAFFTGEEAGLLGSREYVRRAIASGKRIVGALNNDMIGWANDHRLDNTIRYSNPGIRDIQHSAAIQFSDLITYDALYYKSTDAAAYYEAYGDIVGGIGSYPVLGNPHYHQSTDRLETINQQLVAEVAKTTAATLMLLASSPARLNRLTVAGSVAKWDPSPETGVTGYEVRWQTGDGWRSTEVQEATAVLQGITPGGAVNVRALHDRGTLGWDWAVALAPRR
jgi:hypothetical protein